MIRNLGKPVSRKYPVSREYRLDKEGEISKDTVTGMLHKLRKGNDVECISCHVKLSSGQFYVQAIAMCLAGIIWCTDCAIANAEGKCIVGYKVERRSDQRLRRAIVWCKKLEFD